MRREILLLAEVEASAARAIQIAHEHEPDSLRADPNARDALLWNLTVVGEAVSQLPETFRAEYSDVPWNQPVRLRNRIVHGYWSIDLDLLHEVARGDLPPFLARVRVIAAELQ